MNLIKFVTESLKIVARGGKAYYAWVGFLVLLILMGAHAYWQQLDHGLIVTNMRDSVSWAFYIGNFTFLVGVAAAAVMLVVPAYVYNWKPIKEVVLYGELLAVCAVIMCLLFVTVDIGQPFRFWHMIPMLGEINFPSSLLAWDSLVLPAYLMLNLTVVLYMLYYYFIKKEYNKSVLIPLVLLSIPMAISIHTVTAFLYNGLAARPFWNSAILAPRFLASAFCSGPAVLLILFQILRKVTKFEIKDEAIEKIAELMAYAMFINLFLFFAEIFKEYYSHTEHIVYMQYLFSGIGEHNDLVIYAWSSAIMGIVAFFLFLIPATRKNIVCLNVGAVLIYGSVYIEKGIALIIPGFTPDTLHQIYAYTPSWTEVRISMGVFSVGFLLFTLFVKIANEIVFGDFNIDKIKTS